MAVVTLRTRRRGRQAAAAELRQLAERRATRLADASAAPVLVVYGEQSASIYYEGGPRPDRVAPRPA